MRFDPSNSINFEWFGAYHEAFYAEYSKTPQLFPFLMDFMGDMAKDHTLFGTLCI